MLKNVIGVYIRLSDEDRDVSKNAYKDESNSVTNQRDLILDFINRNESLQNMEILEFIDDGFTGTNFERPSLKRLLAKVRKQEISCIVIKDFSRFGRSYLDMGDFLEQVFPFLGVRFIAINDNYDSLTTNGTTAGIEVGFKNLMYDMYSQDLSIKVKSGKEQKMLKGEYISGCVPYGYEKSKEIKNKLVVDETAAVTVRRIFELACNGNNPSAIARILNAENIPSRATYFMEKYKSTKYKSKQKVSKWLSNVVNGMINNEIYLGKIVNRKRKKVDFNSTKTVKVEPSEQIVIENAHAPIVSEAVFLKAQNSIRKFKNKPSPNKMPPYPLRSKVKCGVCKKTCGRSHTKEIYFKCQSYQNDSQNTCFTSKMDEKVLENALLQAIRMQSKIANKAEKLIAKIKNKDGKKLLSLFNVIQKAETKLKELENAQISDYEKFIEGLVDEEIYFSTKDKYNDKIKAVSEQITKLKAEYELCILAENEQGNQFIEHFRNKQDIKNLSCQLVEALVNKIYIYSENRIEIVWNFRDECEEMLKLIGK